MKKDYPKITVVTCTYNSEKYLKKALDSVENQTYTNIEHIFNDSHSTDGTQKIIDDYIERNKDRYPIKVIKTPAKGVANALNMATPHATGDVIHFLHSDDYYISDDALERAAKYFKKDPKLLWITGNLPLEVGGTRININLVQIISINPKVIMSITNMMSHENTFIKTKELIKCGGFEETNEITVEYRLWLRMLKKSMPFLVNEEFTVFIINKNSTSTGSLLNFMHAIKESFDTKRREKVALLIGSYEERKFYKRYTALLKDFDRILSLIESKNVRRGKDRVEKTFNQIFKKKNNSNNSKQ